MMTESMSVDTDKWCYVFNKSRSKGKSKDVEIFERKKRSRGEKMPFVRQDIMTPWEMLTHPDLVVNPLEIAQFLDFTVALKKNEIVQLIDKIKNRVETEEIEKHIKDLAERVLTDPRMINNLPFSFLDQLFKFLEYTENPNIQSQAIIILQNYINLKPRPRVIKKIKTSILVSLICSKDCEVKVQAMCLLRTIALKLDCTSKSNKKLEATLEPLILLINDDIGDNYYLLNAVGKTLAVICEVYPMLPFSKLVMVIRSLLKFLDYSSTEFPSDACLGLLYLCDGRQEMVVAEQDFDHLIHRLFWMISLFESPDSLVGAIAALNALGTIVRWGSDIHIEAIIFGGFGKLLSSLLHTEERDVVENACWIISNITAGSVEHIIVIVSFGLIEDLFAVVLHHMLLDVKKEAALAISNAIHGLCDDRDKIGRFRDWFNISWVESFWTILKVHYAEQQIVSFCLEGLVYLGGVKVSCNGRPNICSRN